MEILFLNTDHLRLQQPLEKFLSERRDRTDIFCLQEVDECPDGRENLAAIVLRGYLGILANKKIEEERIYQATYIDPRLNLVQRQVLLPTETQLGLAVMTQVEINGQPTTICNVHGNPQPGDKLDTPARLIQSRMIVDYFKNIPGPKIIGGDFNLDLCTQSVKIFKNEGYVNLIEKYQILTTRNELAWKKYPDNPQMYADHVFVSPEVKVKSFSVLPDEFSDHLAMVVEIN